MSSKTPYEIRYSLLSLARDILSENQNLTLRMIESSQISVSQSGASVSMLPGDSQKQMLSDVGFTTEDVIEEAEKLYAFVSKDNK
jgi:hypothetical protein